MMGAGVRGQGARRSRDPTTMVMGADIHNHYTANMLICQEIFAAFALFGQEKRKKIEFSPQKRRFRP
jgi:hypothetical protein